MGIFDRLLKRAAPTAQVEDYFKLLTAYSPAFSTFQGAVYEMALTRAAVHAFATHCGKLQPVVIGSARRDLERTLAYQPNPMMDTYSWIYKLATILKVENTAFIVPILDERLRTIGFWPARSVGSAVKLVDGVQYLVYESPMGSGKRLAVEWERVGVMRNHFYTSTLYGESNHAIDPTLDLMSTVDQGIVQGVKSASMIRFLVKLKSTLKPSDIADERKRFIEENLTVANAGGVMVLDQKYDDVKPIESSSYLVDPKQSALIKSNVYDYFGVNEAIIQNSYNENQWNAFYEGAIEPFAIQLSLVMTNMLYSGQEKIGNSIMFESNRLQYASNETKISLATQLFDRGFITQNQGLEIFNMAPVEDGDKRWIRREYMEVDEVGEKE